MFTFLVVLDSVLFILLVIAAGMHPVPSVISASELERRAKRANHEAKAALHREKYLPDVMTLLRVKTTLLLIALVLLLVVTFGWLLGCILAVIVALEYSVIARIRPLQKASQVLYQKFEPKYLQFVEKARPLFAVLRGIPSSNADSYRRFDSREELQQLVDQSGTVLSEDERKVIIHSLGFKEQLVESVMTPTSMIQSIKKTEFLGPLVLSELHELGHSRLPVIGSDINHVVGTLHLKDLLSLDIKRSVTAEKAMDARVYYIRQDQSLEHALAAFMHTHHHLFIVINKNRETVGLLTLDDVIGALLGRKIIDEDDHENLRAVAEHEDEPNNSPEKHTDV